MVNAIVEHEWKERDQEKVLNVVNSIVDMAKNGKLPSGFELNSINVISNERRAICSWSCPSVDQLNGLLSKVNPPTKHSVRQATKIF
ncbi:MAG: hypothetical protein M1267_05535 [Candidatus Thermoplasmatota archaeon]|jgi:hypothetical protein|nr:hypothetical protein [Candidatus Thermoplasmatota archaeon]MCL5799793.1 hypothetical protein [Candidatus Thermoplasmatota archaeon]